MRKHNFQSLGKRCTPSWSILLVLGFKCVCPEKTVLIRLTPGGSFSKLGYGERFKSHSPFGSKNYLYKTIQFLLLLPCMDGAEKL